MPKKRPDLPLIVPPASASMSSAPPGLNRAPWYHPPQLLVMTGFIANTTDGIWGADFLVNGEWSPEKQQATLAEWARNLGRDYDADRVVRTFKEAGATGVIFYDKWHDGLVCHETALTRFKTDRDFVGETVAALRKHRMHIIIYYSVGLDYNPEPQFQDWTCRDAEGNPQGFAFRADWQSLHSPYRQYVIDQLVEIVQKYGPVDGLWLDILGQPGRFYQVTYGWGPAYSRDRYTREAFQTEYGKPIEQATMDELEAFQVTTLERFWGDLRQALSTVQPGVSLTWNGAGRDDIAHPQKAYRLNATADWFSMEGHAWLPINRSARLGHAVDRPVEVGMLLSSSWYTPLSEQAPPPAMSEPDALVAAATAWIQGVNVYTALTPGHSGRYDTDGDVRLLRAVGGWLSAHRPWLTATQPYADVGLLVGHPAPEVMQIPTLGQLWRASHRTLATVPSPAGELGGHPGLDIDLSLQQEGYDTERVGSLFTERSWDLSAYRLVVVPETALLDEPTVQAIRAYVRQGGALLACGHASLFDPQGQQRPDFALADVFGVTYAGSLPGYKQWDPLPDSGLVAGLPRNTGALTVTATTGAVLAVWRSAAGAPALVEQVYGQGRCLYVSAEEAAFGPGQALLAELVARLIGPPPVTLTSARSYARLMRRHGNDLLLYLLERDAGTHAASLGPESVGLTLDTRVLGPIIRAEVLPAGEPVALSRQASAVRLWVKTSPGVTALRLIR